jgi:hypothetical protein
MRINGSGSSRVVGAASRHSSRLNDTSPTPLASVRDRSSDDAEDHSDQPDQRDHEDGNVQLDELGMTRHGAGHRLEEACLFGLAEAHEGLEGNDDRDREEGDRPYEKGPDPGTSDEPHHGCPTVSRRAATVAVAELCAESGPSASVDRSGPDPEPTRR